MEKLSEIEEQIIKAIISDNKEDFPFLENHLFNLYVKNRESTGVGIYVFFGYKHKIQTKKVDALISSNKVLTIEGFKNEITYVLDITNGLIDNLEIVVSDPDFLEKDIDNYKFILE